MLALAPFLKRFASQIHAVVVTTKLPSESSNVVGGLRLLKKAGLPYTWFRFVMNFLMPLVLKVKGLPTSVVDLVGKWSPTAEIVICSSVNEPEIMARIASHNPEILLSVGASHVLGEKVLAIPSKAAVNIHWSLLPEYAGMATYFWYLFDRRRRAGVTLHLMVPKLDAGPIIDQRSCDIRGVLSVQEIVKHLWVLTSKILTDFYCGVSSIEEVRKQDPGKRLYRSHPSAKRVRKLLRRGDHLFTYRDLKDIVGRAKDVGEMMANQSGMSETTSTLSGVAKLEAKPSASLTQRFRDAQSRTNGTNREHSNRSADSCSRIDRSAADFAKRVFDIYWSALAIVLLSPILVAIALAIKLGDGGPVFYKALRIGLHGRSFRMFKFRSMVVDADKGAASTPDDDHRVTPIGKALRKYKIDEFPQLINVLLGQMSLVGPRPQIPWVVELYSPSEMQLLAVKPGMTDLASIRFNNEGELLSGSKDPDRDYLQKIAPEKTRLGLQYVSQWSMRLDIALIFETLLIVLGRRPESGYSSITEQWGMPASPEQYSMAYCRYHFGRKYCARKRVLEVACGAGMGLEYLAAQSSFLVGGEYTWKNLEAAAERTARRFPLLQLDAQHLPFHSGAFDTIICHEAVYYLKSIAAFLAECRRVMRWSGHLVFSLPNKDRPGFIPSPMSTSYYSVPELFRVLRTHGFQPTVLGGYRISGDGMLAPLKSGLRSVASGLGLIPKSMATRARLKRLMHRDMPMLTGIQEGMADLPDLVALNPDQPDHAFKNLYVVAEIQAGPGQNNGVEA